MLEKIIDILKSFFEKYFIQALISIIPTLIIYYFTPDNFNFLNKIGKELYLLFVFIICFLIVELIIYIFKYLKKKKYYSKLKNQQEKEIEKENLNYLWSFVDNLNVNDKKLLNYFMESENKVINITGYLMENRLLEEWGIQAQTVSDGNIKNFDIIDVKEKNIIQNGIVITQYKLKDEIYNALVYSKKKYGKISNFK